MLLNCTGSLSCRLPALSYLSSGAVIIVTANEQVSRDKRLRIAMALVVEGSGMVDVWLCSLRLVHFQLAVHLIIVALLQCGGMMSG
jgi:hypothetical protein